MTEEISDALHKKDSALLNNIHDIDTNLDKFHDYCIRVLNKVGNKDSRKTSLFFATLYLLELAGDEFKNIATHLVYDFKKIDYDNIITIIDSIKKQLDLFYEVFYTFDKSKINQISELDKERFANVNKVYNNIKKDEEKEIFHHLRIITRYINALTELRIEMEF